MDAAYWAGSMIPLKVELIVFVSTSGSGHVVAEWDKFSTCDLL